MFTLTISALAWFCGFGWQPPSTLGLMVGSLVTPIIGSALVALRLMPETRVLSDTRAGGFPLRPVIGASSILAILALISIGSFGLQERVGGEPEERSILLNRRDFLGDEWPPISVPEEPSLFETDLREVVPGEGLLSVLELEHTGLSPALVPRSGTGAVPRIGWFSTRSGDHWPLVFPGRKLPVDSPSEALRLTRTPTMVEPDPNRSRFGAARLVAPNPVSPDLARSAPEQWWSVPVGPEVARLEGLARARSFRSGPLFPLPGTASTSAVAANGRIDPIVVTLFHSAAGPTYEGHSVIGSEAGSRFLRLWRDNEPFDLLGEGRDAVEPPRIMSGLVRTWRSRDAASPGYLGVPAEAARAPGIPPWAVLTQRGLPNNRPSPGDRRASFVLATAVLILIVAQGVRVVLER